MQTPQRTASLPRALGDVGRRFLVAALVSPLATASDEEPSASAPSSARAAEPAAASSARPKSTAHRIPMSKRAAMTKYYHDGKASGKKVTLTEAAKIGGCSLSQAGVWCARTRIGEGLMYKPKGPSAQWPVPKAVSEIAKHLPEFELPPDSITIAATQAGIRPKSFRYIRKQVTERLQTAVADFWFNGDKRAEAEILKSALAAGVEVKLIVDLCQARGKGNSSIEDLIQAGAQILIRSQNWTKSGLLGPNFECTLVLSGTIVTLFEQEFDRMWTTATQDHPSSKRLKTALTREGTEPLPEEESSHSPEDTPVPGKKRKKRKRTLFPTTLALLGGH
ncbi:hypothetical protein PF007_g11433 [Phytophthora fragariae]|uniref:Phospholipase D-like domain-containing protein n=3 Tax=Phytophthora fragariae TaxID=53985 RepID=A0A6A3SGA7_9STRA|nr:hypothetical protein PF011_g10458 [Phytophthora fragariae]KAE9111597.1 hypothetical protein PF007_g11433 [Phytophthora fragariae]